ncbi:MAG: hypothetical protein KDA80_07545 [Planctomycetaceae bacterium]|nr:hypothetical protein [Planctomycetaceae bacterium]
MKVRFTPLGLEAAENSHPQPRPQPQPASEFEGACPQCGGRVRVRMGEPGPCPHCQTRICFNGQKLVVPAPVPGATERTGPEDAFDLTEPDESPPRQTFRLWILVGLATLVFVVGGIVVKFSGSKPEPVPAAPEVVIVGAATENQERERSEPVDIPDLGAGSVFSPGKGTEGDGTSLGGTVPSRVTVQPQLRGNWTLAVPAGQRFVIDGIELVALGQFSDPWTAVLPLGTHFTRFGDEPAKSIAVGKSFEADYRLRVAEVSRAGRYDFEKLMERSVGTLGVPTEPVLAHLWGNYYWQEEHPDAAMRWWKEALQLNPAYAPAHLNLAFALSQQADGKTQAQWEYSLAMHFNHQDAFGISAFLEELSREIPFQPVANISDFRPDEYDALKSSTDLTPEQNQVLRTLKTEQTYLTSSAQRIRMTNNMGAYLLHESQPQLAYEYFKRALGEIVTDTAAQRDRELLKTVFLNLSQSAEKARMPESAYYAALAKSVP